MDRDLELTATRQKEKEIKNGMKQRIRNQANRNSALLCFCLLAVQALYFLLLAMKTFLPLPEWIFTQWSAPVSYAAVYLGLLPYAVYRSNRDDPDALKVWLGRPYKRAFDAMRFARWLVSGVGIVLLAGYLINGVFFAAEMLTGVNLLGMMPLVQPNLASRAVMFAATAFVGPVVAELLFRGTILRNTAGCGQGFAIAAAAVSGAFLFSRMDQVMNGVVLGVVCGFAMVKSRSLWLAFGIHLFAGIMNGTSALLESFMRNQVGHVMGFVYYSEEAPLAVAIGLNSIRILHLAVILLGAYFLYREWKSDPVLLWLDDDMPGLSALQKTGAYLSAPATICYLLLALIVIVLNAAGIVVQ